VTKHSERPVQSSASDVRDERRRLIEEAVQNDLPELLKDIGFYVWDFGIASDKGEVAARAKEVLHETYIKALEIADRYDTTRPAALWLRGIAVKLILHRLRSQRLERQHLTLVADTDAVHRATDGEKARELSETDMFDLLSPMTADTAHAQAQRIEEILALVGGDDAEIIRLHHIEGLDGKELAAKFGTSEGAVYQRLCRARNRLRRELKDKN
jgi:RNA polymerase sigma factor (sigma-70 family)